MSISESDPGAPRAPLRRQRGFLVFAMGVLAVAAPFFAGPLTLFLVGLLLIATGVLEFLATFSAGDSGARRSAYLGGMLSIVGGILLLNEPRWVVRGLAVVLGVSFLIDGAGKLVAAWKARSAGNDWGWTFARALINLLLAAILIARWPFSGYAVVGWVVGCRMLATGWGMVLDRPEKRRGAEPAPAGAHPDARLHLPVHAEFSALDVALKEQEESRRPIDATWCWTFVFLFFAIHLGRMNVTWNLVGMVAPLVAVRCL